MTTNSRQLELGLEGSRRCRSVNLRSRRRAGWWFERIRQVVEGAEERKPKANEEKAIASKTEGNR